MKKLLLLTNVACVCFLFASCQGMKKDTTKKPIKANAIIHKAPEQEIIDSIKNAKLKNKK